VSRASTTGPKWVLYVVIGLFVGILGCIGGFFWLVYALIGVDNLSDEEIRNGRSCTATVLSVTDTKSTLNERTVYEFKLEVKPSDGAAAYRVTMRDTLNSIEAGRVGAGATDFRCVIDRDDTSRVEVFWSD
jgi:hypothetical protein